MTEQPSIETARLALRPWTLEDAPALRRLAGRREIADTMISIPHPYTESQARIWIAGHAEAFAQGEGIHFAIQLKPAAGEDARQPVSPPGTAAATRPREPGESIIGAIELRSIDREHAHAELSLWIGRDWWGHHFASEAALAVVRYGFEELGLNRIQAYHMVRNPASGRVMEKIGMKQEGVLRQCVRKWGRFEDVAVRAILREEWAVRVEPPRD